MATEYLECRRCKRKVAAWSQDGITEKNDGEALRSLPSNVLWMLANQQLGIIKRLSSVFSFGPISSSDYQAFVKRFRFWANQKLGLSSVCQAFWANQRLV
jgi:hypothetical protein